MSKNAPEANQLDCRRTYVYTFIYTYTSSYGVLLPHAKLYVYIRNKASDIRTPGNARLGFGFLPCRSDTTEVLSLFLFHFGFSASACACAYVWDPTGPERDPLRYRRVAKIRTWCEIRHIMYYNILIELPANTASLPSPWPLSCKYMYCKVASRNTRFFLWHNNLERVWIRYSALQSHFYYIYYTAPTPVLYTI